MNAPCRYATAAAFRKALETRLLDLSRREGTDLQRLRRQMAFDRLLLRLFPVPSEAEPAWVRKGGYALELRLAFARSTKDLDLTVRSGQFVSDTPDQQAAVLRARVRDAVSIGMGDYFGYLIGAASLELEGAPEGGWRYPVEARLDGRIFAKFHIDIGIGDEVLPPVDELAGRDWLGFAGLPPVVVPTLSAEQQWAEKLHAYTRPRNERPNSRVKDLVDLLLLVEHGRLDTRRLRAAVEATFTRRGSHPIPRELPLPPPQWSSAFASLAAECGLRVTSADAHQRLDIFWAECRHELTPTPTESG